MSSNLTVVILSKSASNLGPCVSAIRQHDPDVDIVVVDDGIDPEAWLDLAYSVGAEVHGPSDVPRSCLRKLDAVYDGPELKRRILYRTDGEKPFIFSRNANIGIQTADPDSDIVLLNDDALLTIPRGFSILQEKADFWWPRTGLLAATCNNVGNTNQHPQTPDVLGFRDEPRMVCFVCVLIPRRTIEVVGLLDEQFTDYGVEDDDLCLRVRLAGLGIGICDLVYVDHGSLSSSFRGGPAVGGDFKPNLRRFIKKWGADNRGLGKEESPWRALFE